MLARPSDPATSHKAAARVSEFAESHRSAIVSYLRSIAPAGATVDDIADGTGLTSYQVSKRIKELHLAGRIELAGEGISRSGRAARAWRSVWTNS